MRRTRISVRFGLRAVVSRQTRVSIACTVGSDWKHPSKSGRRRKVTIMVVRWEASGRGNSRTGIRLGTDCAPSGACDPEPNVEAGEISKPGLDEEQELPELRPATSLFGRKFTWDSRPGATYVLGGSCGGPNLVHHLQVDVNSWLALNGNRNDLSLPESAHHPRPHHVRTPRLAPR